MSRQRIQRILPLKAYNPGLILYLYPALFKRPLSIHPEKNRHLKRLLFYMMAVLYVGAGINHFVHPLPYQEIIPRQLAYTRLLVYVSGAFETAFGLLLFVPVTRRWAAWGIILLLIAVFPANIQMMINYREQANPYFWITIVRLPLQLVLIYWAYVYTRKNLFYDRSI